MPVSTAYAPITFVGDNVTSTFPITWPFMLDTDIVATRLTIATGVVTPLILNSDYLVTPALNSPVNTGLVTLIGGALSSAYELILARAVPITQLTTWVPNDPNSTLLIQNAVDKLTLIAQDIDYTVTTDGIIGTPSAAVFHRGDGTWANSLIGPLGAATVPADVSTLFAVSQTADAAIKVIGGSSSQSAYRFGVDGSANPWDMQLVYDPALSASTSLARSTPGCSPATRMRRS